MWGSKRPLMVGPSHIWKIRPFDDSFTRRQHEDDRDIVKTMNGGVASMIPLERYIPCFPL